MDLDGILFSWPFSIAATTQAIIGADFLAHNHLCVDQASRRIFYQDQYATRDGRNEVRGYPKKLRPETIMVNNLSRYTQLLDAYPDITTPDFKSCLLYTSPSPRDKRQSRMPSSA